MSINYGGTNSVKVVEYIIQIDNSEAIEDRIVTVTGFDNETGIRIKRAVSDMQTGSTIEEIENAVESVW
jgi:hypothetical protein